MFDDDKLLTVADAARYFSMNAKTFERLFIESGKLVHQRFYDLNGSAKRQLREIVRVRLGDLKKLIDENSVVRAV